MSMMVAAVGEAAVSGVVLVDSVSLLIIQLLGSPGNRRRCQCVPSILASTGQTWHVGLRDTGINYSRRVVLFYSSGVNWKQASAYLILVRQRRRLWITQPHISG